MFIPVRGVLTSAATLLVLCGLTVETAVAVELPESEAEWAIDAQVPTPADFTPHERSDAWEASGSATGFTDVSPDHPFVNEISWLVDKGVTTGYGDGTFRPAGHVTRQAFAAFVFRLAGEEKQGTCGGSDFSDVPVGHAFCEEITWLADLGVTTGYDDGTFRPTAVISRQAMSAFLYRFIHGETGGTCESGVSPFDDVSPDSPFCLDISWMSYTSPQPITQGYADGTFRPTAHATRQATAAFLMRFREAFPEHADVFEYTLAPHTGEIDHSEVYEVEQVEIAAAQYDEFGVMTDPAEVEWDLIVDSDASAIGGDYYALFLPPGSEVYPQGVAGLIDWSYDNGDGTSTVRVKPTPLEELFYELYILQSGSGPDLADLNAGDIEPLGAQASLVTTAEGTPGEGEPAAKLGSLLLCSRASGGQTVSLSGLSLDADTPKVTAYKVEIHIGLFIFDPLVLGWVEVQQVVTSKVTLGGSASLAGIHIECDIPPAARNALEKLIPLGSSGATFGVAPHFKLSFTIELDVEMRTTLTLKIGVRADGGNVEPIASFNANYVPSFKGGTARLRGEAGVNFDLALLDRIGVYGRIYAYLEGSLSTTGLQPPGSDGWQQQRWCTALDLGVGASAGFFADLFVVRWEVELLRKDISIAGFPRESCNNRWTKVSDPNPPPVTSPGINEGDPDLAPKLGDGTKPPSMGGPVDKYEPPAIDLGDGGFSGPVLDTTPGQLWSIGYGMTGATGTNSASGYEYPQPVLGLPAVSTIVECELGATTGAITTGGRLWLWGENDFGQLGSNSMGEDSEYFGAQEVGGLTNVTAAYFDRDCESVFAVRSNGDVYAWGNNETGQLGLGHTEQVLSPQKVTVPGAVRHIESYDGATLVVTTGGAVWGWGTSPHRWVSGDTGLSPILTPVQTTGLPSIKTLESNFGGTLIAVANDGTVWQWGKTYRSGGYTWAVEEQSSSVPKQLSGVENVSQVASTLYMVYAVTTSGKVLSWGPNWDAGSGRGTTMGGYVSPGVVPRLPNVTDIVVMTDHVAVLGSDGTVWTWTNSVDSLRVGQGDNPTYGLPGRVAGLTNVTDIEGAPFYGNVYALLSNGEVWAWGGGSGYTNGDGQFWGYEEGVEDPEYFEPPSVPVRVHRIGNASKIGASVAWGLVIAG